MSNLPQKISREEFYERIWKMPIVQLGKELGFSYVEMVRLCQTLNVPRPESRYWYRRQHGGAEEKTPLSPAGTNTPAEVQLGHQRFVQPKQEKAKNEPDEENSSAKPAPSNLVEASPSNEPSSSSVAKTESLGTPTKIQYTRVQLYEAIWSTSCQKLAASLGLSDVALAKTCKRLGIPRPALGYWARVAVGEKVPKILLPPPKEGQDQIIVFDVAANMRRRKEWKTLTHQDLEELAVELELPTGETPLHPLAQKHQRALEKQKPDESGFIHIFTKDLFRCDMTQMNVAKLCRALHALIVEIEARGYKFKAGADQYSNLQIVKGSDTVTIWCAEGREQIEREPTAEDKRRPSWTWQLKQTKPTGKLSFEVHAPSLRGRRTWTESDKKPLPEILGILVEKLDAVFRGFEEQKQWEVEAAKRREEQAKRDAEEHEKQEKLRAERERLNRHQAKLGEIIESRRENLKTAMQQWMECETMKAFIDICELRWKQVGKLSDEQSAWLKWAREEAVKLHPFAKGYPNPIMDGHFDSTSIPVGGPYPKINLLEEEEPSEPVPAEVQTVYVETKQPFPWWLLHRKR